MIKKIVQTSICIVGCLIFTSCINDKPPKRTPQNEEPTKNIVKPTEINKINFYFENSLSMNGYLEGDDFRQSMAEIIYNFDSNTDTVNTYFVNTKDHKTSSILDKIRGKEISGGDTMNSDHKFIFTNAIKNSSGNNLSIVVTDGIYSMNKKGLTLGDVEKDIEKAFENSLKVNEIETVVLKMSSYFDGRYYSESCPVKGGVGIEQTRPYYILLFGNKEVIDKTLKEIVIINDLEGYQEQARFMITKDLNAHYTVLTQGEEKKGSFEPSDHSNITKKIIKAKKFAKQGVPLKDTFLQFGIAVDYSNLRIPESYLITKSNYTIENNTGYIIEEIKKVEDLVKKSKTYEWIKKQNEKEKFKYTHIIVVQGKSDLYDDLKLGLDINFPTWIANTGTDDDCKIKNDSTTTFAFDRLIMGISKAYEKINDKEDYFKLKINIKAN